MKPFQRSHSLFSVLLLVALTNLGIGLGGRVLFLALGGETAGLLGTAHAFLRGILLDSAMAAYLSVPFVLLGLLPTTLWRKRWFQRTLFALYFLELAVVGLAAVSEGVFIEEFHSRFNFIAVDYLVYTNEVIKNIFESYPMGWILPALLITVASIAYGLFRLSARARHFHYRQQLIAAVSGLAAIILSLLFLEEAQVLQNLPPPEQEIAKNGVHALFAAYRHNEIDYHRFYRDLPEAEAARALHDAFEKGRPGDPAKDSEEDPASLVRNILRQGPPEKRNVVLVLMESMSARFMQEYGNQQGLTPNLDRAAREGLFFDHIYSTGTRTVRGIEAVALSIPPTPGQSIVRRPDAGQIFNLGTVFREHGYHTQFVYGGQAFFDNMGEFFGSNGFEIADQGTIPTDEVIFANAWGVSDEDLFNYSIKRADRLFASQKPFFQFLLTTSNHRPYTYPEGRIDIPSHSGRDGAVKYSDYAVGKFLADAAKKPWFSNTLFIFVADHNASVAGGSKILPGDYRIPMIFYAPGFLKAERVKKLGSQIDLAPTLLGVLNLPYQSRFFGHDLRRAKTERAFLGTYQKVGLWQGKQLTVLAPNKKFEVSVVNGETAEPAKEIGPEVALDGPMRETIGYYQTASDWFREKRLKESRRESTKKNRRDF
jgi:phosphoglycerol transferase MdoB-like AlkP superfamily enzyme